LIPKGNYLFIADPNWLYKEEGEKKERISPSIVKTGGSGKISFFLPKGGGEGGARKKGGKELLRAKNLSTNWKRFLLE